MTVEKSGGPRRKVVRASEPPTAPAKAEGGAPKAQRGDAAKRSPQLPKSPKSPDASDVRAEARLLVDANARTFNLLAATIARALSRAEAANTPSRLSAFHGALSGQPVTLTLDGGHACLKGCFPEHRAERDAVKRYLAVLPLHIQTMGGDRFTSELEEQLRAMSIEPPVEEICLVRSGPAYELLVLRKKIDAAEGGQVLAEVLSRQADRSLTQERLLAPYAEADQSVIYGVLKGLEPMGLIDKPDLATATGLSADELRALAKRITFETDVPRERIVAGLLRFMSTQPKHALRDLRLHVPATEAEVRSLSRRLNAAAGLEPTSIEAAEYRKHVPWPVAPMFAGVLEGMDPTDQELVMGVIYARLRTGDFPTCERELGVTAEHLEEMMASGGYATPIAPYALIQKLFQMAGRGNNVPEHWHDYVALDRNGATQLWYRVMARQRAREYESSGSVAPRRPATTHAIDGKKLFDSVGMEDRIVVNECLNALTQGRFTSHATLRALTGLSRDDLQTLLAGGTVNAPIDAKALITVALEHVASSTESNSEWYAVMTVSRARVEAARQRYAP